MSTNKTKHFVAVAITVMMASLVASTTTMILAPMNLQASTQEEEDDNDQNGNNNRGNSNNNNDEDDSDATRESGDSDDEVKHFVPGERQHISIQAGPESDAVGGEGQVRLKVGQFEGDLGEVVKEITQESAPQSSKAASTTSIQRWTVTHADRSR